MQNTNEDADTPGWNPAIQMLNDSFKEFEQSNEAWLPSAKTVLPLL